MALAKFHSLRGEKSALILVKANKFQQRWSAAYVPADSVSGMAEGQEFQIPDGYSLVDMVDIATGEARVAKDGSVLKTLEW
jgi:hypothetical protein